MDRQRLRSMILLDFIGTVNFMQSPETQSIRENSLKLYGRGTHSRGPSTRSRFRFAVARTALRMTGFGLLRMIRVSGSRKRHVTKL